MPRAVSNPVNQWVEAHVEFDEEVPLATLRVFEEDAKSAIQRNKSPDIGFEFGVNPYRGCYHACAYCYARRTHEYLGFGAGTDFERVLVVKKNLPELLRAELDAKSWKGDRIVFSGITDCYQPLEAFYRLTRRCLEVCLDYRNPVHVITKSAIIARDADVLAALVEVAHARVSFSIAFDDDAIARKIEPGASPPSKRLEAMAALAARGVPTGVIVGPVIMGLNDHAVANVLAKAKDAGARYAAMTLLRLPGSVKDVFLERIEAEFPDRAKKILQGVRETRGGKLNDPRFGKRMTGEGERYRAVEAMFELQRDKLGFGDGGDEPTTPTFRRNVRQLPLFE
jgi:DNA repair photolyase